jgi:predicted glutamine amidotransferase
VCQLIFSNLHGRKLNQNIVASLLLTDTITLHQDGFGIFHNGLINKDVTNPHTYAELGGFLKEAINTDKPVIAHVRQASINMKVDVKNSHPFESEHLVLAHNGTLTMKKERRDPRHDEIVKDMIDSEIFLRYLETQYAKTKDLVKSLQYVMECFTGKFAFLIYEKENNKYYAARGTSADLHISTISTDTDVDLGYVINTELKSLCMGLDLSMAMLQINNVNVIYSQPVKLKDNTIFLLEETGIKEVGELKENHDYFGYGVNTRIWKDGKLISGEDDEYDGYGNYYSRGYSSLRGHDAEIDRLTAKAMKFMDDYHMTPLDLDLICLGTMGVPLAYLKNEKDLDFFLDKMIGKITSNVNKKLRQAVGMYVEEVRPLGRLFYKTNKLQYPYLIHNNDWRLFVDLLGKRTETI